MSQLIVSVPLTYRPEIDGLRAIAVLAVIFYHAGFSVVPGGFLGVDVFFVISGYLIGNIIFSELREGSFSILNFYERRARRILPALFAVCIASFVAAWHLLSTEALSDFGKGLVAVNFFVSNIYFKREAGYFAVEAGFNPLLHTWSLAVEEQFYIFFPLLLAALTAYARRFVVPILAVLAATSLGLAEVISRTHPDTAFFLIHTRAWELLAGALLAISGSKQLRGSSFRNQLLALVGLILCGASFVFSGHGVRHPSLLTLVPVIGSLLLIAFATGETVAGRLLSQRWIVGVGLISYSLYLIHQPVFAFLRISQARELGPAEFVVPIFACIGLSYLSWRFIEQPFRNRRSVSRAWIMRGTAVALVVPVAFGLAAWKRIGVTGHTSPEIDTILSLMNTGRAERAKVTEGKICRYNRDRESVDAFLVRWNCLPETDGPVILVFGDSHSADKAWALHAAGIEVANLGTTGCPLKPDPVDPPCFALNNFAIDLAKRSKVNGIVLAHRWKRGEVTPKDMREVEVFWKQAGVPILLFSPMPEFTNIKEKIVKIGKAGPQLDAIGYDARLLALTDPPVRAMAQNAGFSLIETKAVFCGPDPHRCSAFEDGKPLVVDYGHLSNLGAAIVGRRILETKSWQVWYDSLTRPQ